MKNISRNSDVLSAEELKKYAGERYVEIHKTIGSTNDRAKELVRSGIIGGSVVAAEEQTMGRGRFDRVFVSKSGAGLYMSVVLRENIAFGEMFKITPRAAVAVVEALEVFGVENLKIKWVNDVYLNGKKICGILTEGSANNGKQEYAVVGIGINLGKNEFSGELRNRASSVYNETGRNIPRAQLAAEIVKRLENPPTEYMKKYREYSCVIGKKVRVENGNACFDAVIRDVDSNGFLIADKDGERIVVNSGEVIMR